MGRELRPISCLQFASCFITLIRLPSAAYSFYQAKIQRLDYACLLSMEDLGHFNPFANISEG